MVTYLVGSGKHPSRAAAASMFVIGASPEGGRGLAKDACSTLFTILPSGGHQGRGGGGEGGGRGDSVEQLSA